MTNALKVVVAVAVVAATTVLASTDTERFGQWRYVEKKDKFDDSDRSFIYVASGTGRSVAVMRMSDGINIVYNWNSYMGGDRDNDVSIRYRVAGKQASEPEYWRMLQGNRAAYARMNRVQGMLREFGSGGKGTVAFRVTDPMDGETKTDEFSLDGFAEAWRRLSNR